MRRDVAVAAAEAHVRIGVVAGQRDVLAAALRDDRALYALLLTRHHPVVGPVRGAERVRVRAVAVRRADAHVLARAHAERDGVSGGNVESLRVRERLRVRRVDDDAHALRSRHRTEPLVRPRYQPDLIVFIQHPTSAQHRRRPAVL